MTQHERIIAAAEAVAAGNENYSCNALRHQDAKPGEYAKLFAPTTEYQEFLDELRHEIPGSRELRQWRILALCFYAAMRECY